MNSQIREAQIQAMTTAGQKLAVHWGHPPWSESWARTVAIALLDAAASVAETKSDGLLRDRIADMLAYNDECGAGPVSRQEYLDDAAEILAAVRGHDRETPALTGEQRDG